LAAFFVVTLLPAAGLVWLGWTLISQDSTFVEQQLRNRLDGVIDVVAAAMARDLVVPAGRILVPHSSPEPADVWSSPRFAAPRAAEQQEDWVAAADGYRALARLGDAGEQAAARFNLARVLRRAGRTDDALAVYGQLKDTDDVRILGSPASLLSALARVQLLDTAGRQGVRDAEAATVRADLARGRWGIDAPTFEDAWAQVTKPAYFVTSWQRLWADHGIAAALLDAENRALLTTPPLAGPIVTRTADETHLPWTLRIASASPAIERTAFGDQRRQWWLVLGLAAFLALAGAYFVTRGVRRELAAADLQSTFVSAVSHEFRTPLTSMSHLIELLRDHPAMDEGKRQQYYDALEQEAARLRRFVDQLLDFGRLQSGVGPAPFEPIDAFPVVAGIVNRFRESPAAAGHSVTCSGSGGAFVKVDPEILALALTNLLENAAKYSAAGPAIHVAVDADDARDRVRIRVRDEGIGVAPDDRERIFDRFVRGANARKSGVRGNGVGLALARELIRAQGGDVTFEPGPDRGSVFTIGLPLTATAVADPGTAIREAS
jgi:signal transduction histidine kinase